MINTRVAGHTLRHEGMAYVPFYPAGGWNIPIWEGGQWRTRMKLSGGSEGSALCSCGWRSEVLKSNALRRRAHKAHKLSVVRADETQGDTDDRGHMPTR